MRDTSGSGRTGGAPPPVSLDTLPFLLHPENINEVLKKVAIALRGEEIIALQGGRPPKRSFVWTEEYGLNAIDSAADHLLIMGAHLLRKLWSSWLSYA